MRRKAFRLFTAAAFLGLAAPAVIARPPEKVLQQMDVLAQVDAAIGMCVGSAEYRALADREQDKFWVVLSRIDQIAKLIENRYGDDFAYAAIKFGSARYAGSVDFHRKMAGIYSRKCAPQILVDSATALSEAESVINRQRRR